MSNEMKECLVFSPILPNDSMRFCAFLHWFSFKIDRIQSGCQSKVYLRFAKYLKNITILSVFSTGTHPTTLNFRTGSAKLCTIGQSRQHMDFDKVSQSKERPNANRFYQENSFGTAVILQFVIGIQDNETAEFWNCNIGVKRRKLVIVSLDLQSIYMA